MGRANIKVGEQWHVTQDDKRFGPYASDALAQWIATGRITTDAMVSNGGPWITTAEFMRRQAERMNEPEPQPIDSDMIETEDAQPAKSPANSSAAQKSPASTSAPAAAAAAVLLVDDAPPERDRIVIVGRRQSGKTIYLASVYAALWRSLNGFCAKALSGDVHSQLMRVYQSLRSGEWPASTLGTAQIEMEVEYAGKKRLVVTLDYAGEIFRKAFVEEDSEFAGVKELVHHIDRALAVILLIDPSVIVGKDHDEAMDDDFGLVQAVQHIRNWPGGDDVPVVMVLTKMDQYQGLLDRFGSAKEFVRQQFPAMVRLLKKIPIFQISAVQVEIGPDGHRRPRPDFQPINIEQPLKYCLNAIERDQQKILEDRQEQERLAMEVRLAQAELQRERRQNRVLAYTIICIILAGAAVAGLILHYKPQ